MKSLPTSVPGQSLSPASAQQQVAAETLPQSRNLHGAYTQQIFELQQMLDRDPSNVDLKNRLALVTAEANRQAQLINSMGSMLKP